MRLKHLKRSTPTKLTASTLHLWCTKGKQRANRNGFEWTIPAKFISMPTYNWAERLLEEWNKLPPSHRERCGVVFDPQSREPLTYNSCVSLTQEAMRELVENPEEVSTYTWRRVMPTLGMAAKFTGVEMLALGDWQDKSLGGKEVENAKMPIHYGDNKGESSKRIKHEAAIIMGSIMHYERWEAIPESAYRDARQDPSNYARLDEVIEEDSTVIWKKSVQLGKELRKAFRLKIAEGVKKLSLIHI